jgi:hypothetical protein
MGRRLVIFAIGASLLALIASACAGEDSATGSPQKQATQAPPRNLSAADYDRSLFDESSTTIDNPWWPLAPGRRWVWTGWTEEDGERIAHRLVFTVTDLTKVIDGVRTVVGWDRDFSDGRLVEAELIFLAQDKYGNVWHFGQYSETYEGTDLVGGQVWLQGHLKGAKAGIMMRANPQPRTPAYSEGFAPAPFFWDDWGKVAKVGEKTCVPAGCYANVLVIDEYEPRAPGAFQIKYYARGVGNVRTGWRGKDANREVLVLQRTSRLGPAELAKARVEALKLETRARVYGSTPPAERRPAK